MKQFFKLSIILLALLCGAMPLADAKVKKTNRRVATGINAKKKVHAAAKSKRSKPVYYVVVCGDDDDLIGAVTSGEQMTFGAGLWVYRVKINGKTLYRTCIDSFSTRKEAQNFINQSKEDDDIHYLYPSNTWWIWKSNGPAECVSSPAM